MASRRTRRSASSPKVWRPTSRTGPTCGHVFDGKVCNRRGAHYCEPRADRVVAFFAELLVHTKGSWAREAFILSDWQEYDIIRPLFGEVVWSKDWNRYTRRYRIAYVVLARKNGKSELAAGVALYLLVGDDEESAEVYGAAKDTKQAGKVWEPAKRMVELSPDLSKRLGVNKQSRRIFDEKTASYYEIITSDALGELGHNPHGFVLDEVISQPDDSLWNAMRTAAGTRTQPLMFLCTTETNDPHSFGATMIDEAERIQSEPSRAPHIFSYVRKMPSELDVWDEKNWPLPNPALGDFLSAESLREEAIEARNDPTKENSFRQFRANQRVQQTTRWMPMHLWDASSKEVWPSPDWPLKRLKGKAAFGGLDLSSKIDLTSLAWVIPSDDRTDVLWRFWVPEDQIPFLDQHTGGKAGVWVKEGWIVATEGNVIDYDAIYEQIDRDAELLKVAELSADPWLLEPVRQEITKRLGVDVFPVPQTYRGMSEAMKQLMVLVKSEKLETGRNPVARWNADAVEVRQDDQENIRPVKPDRLKSGKRIDGIVAVVNAIDGHIRRGQIQAKSKTVHFA